LVSTACAFFLRFDMLFPVLKLKRWWKMFVSTEHAEERRTAYFKLIIRILTTV
jgi:hypothetical protein